MSEPTLFDATEEPDPDRGIDPRLLHALPDSMTLGEAREWLRDRLGDGARCPVCTQYARVYQRSINSGMARALIVFYRRAGGGWAYKPDVLRGIGSAARDEALLRYWGLFEEAQERRDDGGRLGWWRVTDAGVDFVLGRSRVRKYAHIYDSDLLQLTGDLISIRDALGDRFDYDELMATQGDATGVPV